MKFLYFTLLIFVVTSCSTGSSTNISSFKEGRFKTYLGKRKDSSYFHRTGNIQIEHYRNKVDTFYIHWKSSFEYELRKINPTTTLDSIPFIVKIIAIKQNYYKFKGGFLGSNFKQEGITYKVEE